MPAPDHPLLVARKIGFTLPDDRVLLHDLNLALGPGRTALVGANGIGKSTLLHILVGRIQPTSGQVVRKGRVAFLAQRPPAWGEASPGGAPTLGHALGIAPTLAALPGSRPGSPCAESSWTCSWSGGPGLFRLRNSWRPSSGTRHRDSSPGIPFPPSTTSWRRRRVARRRSGPCTTFFGFSRWCRWRRRTSTGRSPFRWTTSRTPSRPQPPSGSMRGIL